MLGKNESGDSRVFTPRKSVSRLAAAVHSINDPYPANDPALQSGVTASVRSINSSC